MMRDDIGLYIHIPFCSKKCDYCDFYSVKAEDALMDAYLSALCASLKAWSKKLGGRKAQTLYLGGGTPILFGAARLTMLLETAAQYFGLNSAEISLEANPNHTDYETLVSLKNAGYNRISFGVQSALDDELKLLTRVHTAAQARDAIVNARRAGFANINADLMLGIPGQTEQSMNRSLQFLSELEVEHISAYLLKVEEGTPFYDKQDFLDIPGEDLTAALYLGAAATLNGMGYRQYEISNFAKDGFACAHNLLYWDCREYLGIGPAAHSFIDGARFAYPRSVQDFIAGATTEKTDDGGDFFEYAMLRLRLNEGFIFDDACKRFDFDRFGLTERAESLKQYGLCSCDEKGIRLTTKGFLFSNYCIGEILF